MRAKGSELCAKTRSESSHNAFIRCQSPARSVPFGATNGPVGELNTVVELLSLRAPTVGDLPPPKTQRWVARRKAAVVTALRSGTITMRKPYVASTPPKRNSSPGSCV